MEKNGAIAKKSNALVESRHKLNTHQQRLFLLFVSKIRAQDKPDKTYRLKRSELAEVSKGYLDTSGKIKETLEAMLTKTIDLSKGEVFERATYFSSVKYDPSIQEAHVEVHKSIQKELFDLHAKFTLVDLQCTLNLDSPYYISLYELLKSKEFQGRKGGGVDIDLDQLKFTLGCDDLPTYSQWTDFKRYILDKAQKALNKHTDTKFTYKPIKTGRKVTTIRFFIEENEKWQPTIMSLEKKNNPVSRLKPRTYAKEGDTVLMSGNKYKVGPSGVEVDDNKTFTIGQLTTALKAGKIEVIKEG